MTVTYTPECASITKKYGVFWKLLFRWKGSIYKVIWPDLLLYLFLYYILSFVYRFALDETQRRTFEQVSLFFNNYTTLIPVAFVLGFYVSLVVGRWWDQYQTIPWPDTIALFVSTCIEGQDSRSRAMRRTIMRYVNTSYVLTCQMISPQVKRRFPTLDSIKEAGIINDNEQRVLHSMDERTQHSIFWMPLIWAGSIVARARKEGKIDNDLVVKTLLDHIATFRGGCGMLTSYDWINIPLVYTQVVTLAVYTYFIATLMGRQFLDPLQKLEGNNIDLYFPLFTILQFVFYMGWLKVAESLLNPFGEDDDDFEINWLIDRNLQVSYLIVDTMHEEHPEVMQDKYWDEVFPKELPYGGSSVRNKGFKGSTAEMKVETEATPEPEGVTVLPMVPEESIPLNTEPTPEVIQDNNHP